MKHSRLATQIEFVIPDKGRTIPDVITGEKARKAYMCLPSFLLPQKPMTGRLNFTIADRNGAKVEIQLGSQTFFIRNWSDGTRWITKDHGSPNVAWRTHETIEAAWEQVEEKIGGWVHM